MVVSVILSSCGNEDKEKQYGSPGATIVFEEKEMFFGFAGGNQKNIIIGLNSPRPLKYEPKDLEYYICCIDYNEGEKKIHYLNPYSSPKEMKSFSAEGITVTLKSDYSIEISVAASLKPRSWHILIGAESFLPVEGSFEVTQQ